MQNRHQFDRMRNEMSPLPSPSLSLLFPHECLKFLFVPNFFINNCENHKRMRFGCRYHLDFHFIATKQWNKINMNAITAFFVCVGSQNFCLLEKPSHSSHHTYTEFHMNKFYPHLKCVCVCVACRPSTMLKMKIAIITLAITIICRKTDNKLCLTFVCIRCSVGLIFQRGKKPNRNVVQ